MDSETEDYTPAVENGGTPQARINYLSVSQLQKAADWLPGDYGGCERKWWWRYVQRVKEPKGKAAELGEKVHKELENYERTGQDALGPIASKGKRFLPPLGQWLRIEEEFGKKPPYVLTVAGIPITGKVDLRTQYQDRIRVTDHKTAKDVEEKAAKPEDLTTTATSHGIQTVGYALREFLLDPNLDRLELEHIYYPTERLTKQDAKPVQVWIDRATAFREWGRMGPLGERLKEIAKAPTLETVKPNWNACERCFYRERCFAFETEKTMGLMSKIAPGSAPSATPAPAPAALTATPPPAPAKRIVVMEAATMEEAEARGAALAAAGLPLDFKGPVPTPAAPTVTEVKSLPAVLPPDAPKSDPKLASEAPAPAEIERPKRGRKSKDEAESVQPATVVVMEPAPALRVYVNTIPTGPFGMLNEYLLGLKAKLEKQYGAVEVRCAPKKYKGDDGREYESPIAYGAWKGALFAMIKATPPPPGTYVILGNSELQQTAAEAFEMICKPGDFARGVTP